MLKQVQHDVLSKLTKKTENVELNDVLTSC